MEAVLKRPALLAAAQLLAFWPVWRWYTLRLGTAGDEKWGLLALFAAALMWLPSGAWADAEPPGLIGFAKFPLKLMRSQRIVSPVFACFSCRSGDAKLVVAIRPTTTATARNANLNRFI